MRVCVSACLLGVPCRYSGRGRFCEDVANLCDRIKHGGGAVIQVCPEVAGGLATPRPPAEIRDGRVITIEGTDVTEAFETGARTSLERVNNAGGVPLAVLCRNSPSCGSTYLYDGTYTGRLVAGDGVFTRLLKGEGVAVTDETIISQCRPSVEHPVAIVLGTGLGHLTGLVKPVRRIAYEDILGFPQDAQPLSGHRFEATVGTIAGVPVIVYPGRVHLYQGYSALEVTALVRHAYRLGSRTIFFAGATGAIPGKAEVGLGVVSDHINLTGQNPLVAWNREGELSFVDTDLFDMADIYSPYLKGIAKGVAEDEDIALGEGVLAGVLGPSFETGAEVRALAVIGVSYVGMSTVVEAIMAHALGMQVLGLTLAANYSGSVYVNHESVLAAAHERAEDFERLVTGILRVM